MGFSVCSQELNQSWKTCPISSTYASEALSPHMMLEQYTIAATITDYQEDVPSSLFATAMSNTNHLTLIYGAVKRSVGLVNSLWRRAVRSNFRFSYRNAIYGEEVYSLYFLA